MDRLVYFIDNEGPAIVRRLSSQTTGTFNITAGMSFRLRIRARDDISGTVVLDKLMTPDVNADTLTYDPVTGDFPAEGIFRAWIHLVEAQQDTDEFEIVVLQHAPGEATRTSVIWRAARAMAPVAWDYLRRHPDYGDPELQRFVDLAKLRIFRSAVPVANEASLDPRVIDYIALKVLVDHVLNAAIDYWTNQVVSRTARQSDEVETYPDRIAATTKLLERYTGRLADQQVELEETLGAATGPTMQAPALGGSSGDPITPGLETMPPPYRDLRSWESPRRW